MSKRNGVITLLVMLALLAGGIYISIFGMDSKGSGSAANIKQGLDLAGGVSITYQAVGEAEPSKEDMADTIYKLQKRVEGYSTEAQVYQEGSDRINIEIPGVSDANAVLEELGKPGSLFFTDKDGNQILSGTDVADAQAGYQKDSMNNQEVVVQLTFTPEGTKAFADATTKAVANHDVIYIIYDGEIVSAPAVQAAITDGRAIITGSNTFEEAERLASTIRIGGLKLELEELRSNVVGAQLGAEAIKTSLYAAAIGFGIVAVFMIAVYFIPGLASVIALAIYVCLMILMLNAFEVTLTLPGIAGIILSIGMAVDANVIIFARIREEIATGKTVSSSIKIGFQKALSAILDGNITTLIAAIVLGAMGTGSIKGFAQTLGLGIVISMFTALVISKLILNSFYALGIKDEKFYGKAKERKQVDFLSKKVIFIIISLVCIISGFVFMGLNSSSTGDILNYSLEFKGGTSTNVTFNEDLSLADIDGKVIPVISSAIGGGNVQAQKVQGSNEVIFKTSTLDVSQREAMQSALVSNFGVDAQKITAESISSTISNEMRSDAIVAVIVATICMLIYIWFRFKDIRFAASSVLALCHDVLVVLAFYAAAKISVGSTFIACMLTIVGYSINATIVIFDRIRENLAVMGKKDNLKDLVNRCINQTLSRSIFTSFTTFVMVAALYVFGVTSIKEFALPLMVGILVGTYSSVCLTGAMWYIFRTKFAKKEDKGASKK
ncbi:MAG: protein translocase subunit SecD [Lachnospiraceae bacterium]|nr:protein translocase subunit SecD [Lachnospiraceae bacterium]